MNKKSEYVKMLKKLNDLRASVRRWANDPANLEPQRRAGKTFAEIRECAPDYAEMDALELRFARGEFYEGALQAGAIKFGEDD